MHMSEDAQTALIFWLGDRLLAESAGATTQQILFNEIRDRVAAGSSIEEAARSLAATETRAGDFGVEIAGSMLAIVLAEGLKTFWSAYLKEAEERLGKQLAKVTIDYLKQVFRRDLSGPESGSLRQQIGSAVRKSCERHRVDFQSVEPVLAEISHAASADTGMSSLSNDA